MRVQKHLIVNQFLLQIQPQSNIKVQQSNSLCSSILFNSLKFSSLRFSKYLHRNTVHLIVECKHLHENQLHSRLLKSKNFHQSPLFKSNITKMCHQFQDRTAHLEVVQSHQDPNLDLLVRQQLLWVRSVDLLPNLSVEDLRNYKYGL